MTGEEELKYYEMFDAMAEAVYVVDAGFRVLFQNLTARQWQQGLGISGEATGRDLFEFYPDLPGGVRDEYRRVFDTGRILVTKETRMLAGREVTTETRKIPIFRGGRVVKIVACVKDVTEEVRTAARLQESEEKYRALVESTDDSIYLVDRECRYLFMNRRHKKRMGFTGEEFVGRAYADFHTPEQTAWLREKVACVFALGESLRHEHRSQRDGHHFLMTLSPIRRPDGAIAAVTVVSKDVSELKRLEEELRSLTLTDPLTGLHNRRGFFTLAEQQLRLADRRRVGVYMLYADLDGLKEINDGYGHHEGDRALAEVGRLLKTTYRTSDVVARIGGDEFAVIPVGTAGDVVPAIIARFQQNLDAANAQAQRPYRLSVSLGVVMYDPTHPQPLVELLAAADRLMYQQKRAKHGSA